MSDLVDQARALRDRLIDQHNRYFTGGQPQPHTVIIRRRLKRAIHHASQRLIRRLVHAATPRRIL